MPTAAFPAARRRKSRRIPIADNPNAFNPVELLLARLSAIGIAQAACCTG